MTSQQWKPSWPRYLAFARTGLIVVGVAFVAGLVTLAISRTAALAILPLEVAIVGSGSIAFGAQALRIRRSSFCADHDWVTWQGVFARRRLRRTELRGVLAPITQPMSTATTRTLLLTDGRQQVRLAGGIWDESELSRIADALGIEQSFVPQSAKAVERTNPGTTTVFARHPWRTALGAALVIMVVVSGVAVALVLTAGSAPAVKRGPARVSPATVTDQTQVIDQVAPVISRRGWRTPVITLETCGGSNGDPAGWYRHVSVIDEKSGPVPASATAKVQAILRQHGYTLLDPERIDETVVLDGVGDSSTGLEAPWSKSRSGATRPRSNSPDAASPDRCPRQQRSPWRSLAGGVGLGGRRSSSGWRTDGLRGDLRGQR